MASHNAKDSDRKEAHILRQLCSLDEWKGKLVHLAMEQYFIPELERGNLILCSDITEKTLVLAKKQFQFSQNKKYRQTGLTKKEAGDRFLALRNHEYNLQIYQRDLDRVWEEIKKCYHFLYSQARFIKFLSDGDWYKTEVNLPFKFPGSTVTAKPDLRLEHNCCSLRSPS